ncbi:hypothetical protein [Nocardiopsis ansamitocini]|uniref:Uncharacterized protein n=1 Tax=Nocardiopsis ansamitocini TaxID=1670832 RepID=A0A9W6UK32_9ACTN|nr:hypothetical protein [Nocardiopsis ansamitocini]GLU49322.1 hypothetical protein Nans01_36730 [Nocardiopsis ansamitocini]
MLSPQSGQGRYPDADEGVTQAIPPVREDDNVTQAIPPVPDEDATQAIPPVREDLYGGRPMFRDEVPPQEKTASTAQIDLSGFDEYSEERRSKRGGRGRNGGGGGGGRNGRGSRGSGVDRTTLAMAGGFAALVVIGGGGAFLLATSGGQPDPADFDTTLVSDESTDPAPLKPGELFAQENVEISGETYTLVVNDDTDKCETTAQGDFGQVLDDNGCRQVVRATYVNESLTRAVTVGVAALPDTVSAKAVHEGQDPAELQWFAGLAGPEGTGAERLEGAGGHASGALWGRYVVFTLTANTDGSTPEEADSALAETGEEFIDLALRPLGERAL